MIEDTKLDALNSIISGLGSVVVAFSGGVDSTLLLAMCSRKLGGNAVLAVTADSPTMPRRELTEAKKLARELGAKHIVVPTAEMQNECFASNPADRCYYCKLELFTQLRAIADQRGFRNIAYGATQDDVGDYRPGLQAARDVEASAPLLEAGFTKQDVRELSGELGLRTAHKPAMACLASRFPYGTHLTPDKLAQVERAEDLLRYELGFPEVRVRYHGTIVRLEIPPEDFARLLSGQVRERVIRHLKDLGFLYVTLDLMGIRSGSMNESLEI